MMRKPLIIFLLGVIAIAVLPLKSMAEASLSTEEQLKTVYIYNFMRFVQWPEDKMQKSTYQACIYPNNRFGTLLLQLEQRKIADKGIKVQALSLIQAIKNCHVVFLDNITQAELTEVLTVAEKNHVLTVSDQHGFVKEEGMIQLFVDEGKVRFNINYYRSQLANLEISSKLIGLAAHVIRGN